MKKLTLFLTLFMLFSLSVNAQFCNDYADKAVSQYKLAKKNNLPNINWPLWTDDWNGHLNWCRTVSHEVADKETAKRQAYLDKYIEKNKDIHKATRADLVKNKPKYKIIETKNESGLNKNLKINQPPSVSKGVVATIPRVNPEQIQVLSSIKYTVGHYLSADKDGRSTVYRDRNFLYWNIPAYLKGLDYLITRNQDKFTSEDIFFSINNNTTPIIAYMAIDPNIAPPAWMIKQGYQNTYDKLTIWTPDNNSFVEFNIYKKEFQQGGNMIFGGNQNKQGQKQGNMYLVFFNVKDMKPLIDISGDNGGSKITGFGTIRIIKINHTISPYVKDVKLNEQEVSKNEKDNKICTKEERVINGKNTSFFLLNEQRSTALFPGNILSISEIESGNYKKANTPERKPYRISTSLSGSDGKPTVIVKDADLNDYRNAKAELLKPANFNHKFGPYAGFGNFDLTESALDFSIKASGGFSYLFYSGGASAGYKSSNRKNHYIVSIDKIYYDIDFAPKNIDDFFKDSNIPNNSDWVYVSNIKYGTKLILNVESDYSLDEVQAALNFKYNALVTKVNAEMSLKTRSVLKNMHTTVITLGEHPSDLYLNNLISNPDDTKAFAKAYSYDKINAYTQLYPLSYTLKFVDDQKIAGIETYAKYKQQTCRKMSNIMRFEFKDIYVVESDDSSGGEDLKGWMKIKPWAYGEKVIFNQQFQDDVEGGDAPIILKTNQIYYFKYSSKGLDDPKKYLEIEGSLTEIDDISDDDLGHPIYRIQLNDIFSGAIYDKSSDKSLTVPNAWISQMRTSNYPCNDCLIIPFHYEGTKVLVRFKIDLLDKIPQGSKIGF